VIGDLTFRPMLPDDLDWLQARTQATPARDIVGMVAELEGNRAAIVAAERWSETAAWMHLVIDDPRVLQQNKLLDEIARYVFAERGRNFILSTTSSENSASRAFQAKLGFKVVAVVKDAFDFGEDMIIMRLDASEWRKRRGH
jgi:L-amino acid N-acyltransferase YncA